MIYHADGATICALSTPSGIGAIALIRVSGSEAIAITDRHFSGKLSEVDANQVVFGRFIHDGQVIDDVLISLFRAPKSYTGEDTVEISCHGGAYIRQTILQALITSGCRYAREGEFTLRAFMNGKMDLSQAEAVADLIAAESEGAHKLALHQLRGGFSKEIAHLREQLINFASLIELELDFSEEDVEFADRAQLEQLLKEIDRVITSLIASFKTGNAIKQGIPVAIVGKPNAGKSTLLNAFLNEDRAIVSDIPGTTRDTIEDQVIIGSVKFRFIDTAGLRDTEDIVEKIGVERSHAAMQHSAIIIYLFDVSEIDPPVLTQIVEELKSDLPEEARVLAVGNKIDLNSPENYGDDVMFISAREGENMEALKTRLLSLSDIIQDSADRVIVTNLRHYEALQGAKASLDAVTRGLGTGLTGDFLATDIRRALHHLGEITGSITTDDLLGNIFGKFCIGK